MNIVDSSEEIAVDEPRRILLYGDTGMRKTTSLLTLPNVAMPALMIDFDRKSDMLRGEFAPGALRIATVDTVKVKNRVETHVGYEQAKEIIVKTVDDDELRTYIIDSATLLYDHTLDHVRDLAGRKEEKGTELQDYGLAGNLFKNFVRALHASGKNIIMICHEHAHEDENTAITRIVPELTGKLGTRVPRYFQHMVHAIRDKRSEALKPYGGYGWETMPRKSAVASTTLGHRGEVIPPDFKQFWEE